MQFIMTVQILIKNNIAEDEYFKAAIVNMTIYVLKMAIESEDTVEVAIFSMQILLNANGLKESMPYLSKFCSIAVQAYLKFLKSKRSKSTLPRSFTSTFLRRSDSPRCTLKTCSFLCSRSCKRFLSSRNRYRSFRSISTALLTTSQRI